MFAGPSGTGKTMAASVIARRLDLDLHRIELGAVMSKYIGETEKNIDRAFEAARRANALLFVDEADALLGKRSEIKDAHDRYANVEIAYLLQKLEDHPGVVIVATNLAQNIDEAFSRRMHYVLNFPLPTRPRGSGCGAA
jgi:SpoVK/Ycf46/Vps4 family AAA+-type ATPase